MIKEKKIWEIKKSRMILWKIKRRWEIRDGQWRGEG